MLLNQSFYPLYSLLSTLPQAYVPLPKSKEEKNWNYLNWYGKTYIKFHGSWELYDILDPNDNYRPKYFYCHTNETQRTYCNNNDCFLLSGYLIKDAVLSIR